MMKLPEQETLSRRALARIAAATERGITTDQDKFVAARADYIAAFAEAGLEAPSFEEAVRARRSLLLLGGVEYNRPPRIMNDRKPGL